MSVWINNLKIALEHKEVVILHGNVRDKYINHEKELIYNNLTELIQDIASKNPLNFSSILFYDAVGQERGTLPSSHMSSSDKELSSTSPSATSEQRAPPSRILAKWARILSSSKENTLATIFYLDKLVSYKASYTPDERELALHLEKLIENIASNNRLLLVALQDSMIPVELYTNSPKTRLILIPSPGKEDRRAYFRHRLGKDYKHFDLAADFADGLFLRDLDNIVKALGDKKDISTREIRRIINKYRIGEQEDYWGNLDIEKLNSAPRWFVEEGGVEGQDEAVKSVVDTLTMARAGLSGMASGTLSKPKGVLFFAGTTGVGKTFLAKKLARFLFGSEEAFIRFDMSEYMGEETVNRLIGSPPGYVAHERGGMLTNAVKEKPFSVILFDEIEKAHPRIMDIFLQILDEGRLTDSRGQTIFFTETVIIFTSNIGTRTTDSRGNPIKESSEINRILENKIDTERTEKIRQHFKMAVERFFSLEISRPELLNRIGNNIIPFNNIDSVEIQKKIVKSHFKRVKDDFEDRFKSLSYKLEISESVVEYLVLKYNKAIENFGGRAVTNAIDDEIMKSLSKAILRAEYDGRQGVMFRIKEESGKIVVEG